MSTRRMRSNQRVLLASRRATLAITVAALGLGAGSSLAEAADEAPTPTSTQATTEDALVIELVIESPPEPIAAQPAEDQPDGGAAADPPATSETAPAPDSFPEPAQDTELPMTAALETTTTTEPVDADHDHDEGEGRTEGGHDEGEGGHEGGTEGGHDEGEGGSGSGQEGGHEGSGSGEQGQGTPYSITFSVEWRSEAGTPIAVLGDVLPDDQRTLFELTAASRTGKNRPTSAVCTYADSGDRLVCEFENPGHRSEVDGMIVPARPTATYSVNVSWDTTGWTIDGANAGPYSARDLCPRGGQGSGHDDGHDDGHDSGHETLTAAVEDGHGGSQGDGTFPCEHVVVIQQIRVATPEPEPEPETKPPAEPATPDTEEARAALSPSAPAAIATPRALPATGSSISMMLAIGTALAAIGVGLAVVARRTTPAPIGGRVDERGRMPA